MARHEPYALDAGHVGHVAEELGERLAGDHVSAVSVHVLPQQRHLLRFSKKMRNPLVGGVGARACRRQQPQRNRNAPFLNKVRAKASPD